MIKVYDQDMNLLAVLENADSISYSLPHNDLWTASFQLPARDPKNTHCQMHNLVEITDGARDIGIYRIIGVPDETITGLGGYVQYSCEHVMATLLDDILFGYHEIGGVEAPTSTVLEYILGKQETPRWRLGVCDFADFYAYKFENSSLLSALLSLGEVLLEPFTWEFDTSTLPWRVSLRRADAQAGCGIYYRRNMQQIRRSVDASTLVTRLYVLGYGEGVNQLTIKDINGGLPYIDADTASIYGIKKSVFCDRRIEDPAILKARGEAMLESLKIPYTTYTAKAIDLATLTGDEWDRFMPGKVVHVLDGADGIEFEARITCVSKADVQGRPGDVEITIANSVRDIADSINTLADRQGINDLYSQGATNLYAQQFADNADPTHPAVMRVYIPKGCVRINQMLLSYSSAAFRAYETGAAAGGSSMSTSESGGAVTVTEEQRIVTTQAVTGGPIAGRDGDTSGDTGYALTPQGSSMTQTGSGGSHKHEETVHYHNMEHYHLLDQHTHGIAAHSHVGSGHSHTIEADGSLSWGHQHSLGGSSTNTGGVLNYEAKEIKVTGKTSVDGLNNTGNKALVTDLDGPTKTGDSVLGSVIQDYTGGSTNDFVLQGGEHSHGMAHKHNFSHSHNAVVTITIPEMAMSVPSHNHSVNIPAHSHGIIYGIYEGGSADTITLIVDGELVEGITDTSVNELDIAGYLKKDEDGKILRGQWHEIALHPNTLSRIEANLFVQTFIQSVGGGDY